MGQHAAGLVQQSLDHSCSGGRLGIRQTALGLECQGHIGQGAGVGYQVQSAAHIRGAGCGCAARHALRGYQRVGQLLEFIQPHTCCCQHCSAGVEHTGNVLLEHVVVEAIQQLGVHVQGLAQAAVKRCPVKHISDQGGGVTQGSCQAGLCSCHSLCNLMVVELGVQGGVQKCLNNLWCMQLDCADSVSNVVTSSTASGDGADLLQLAGQAEGGAVGRCLVCHVLQHTASTS
mmetsp:Transcript_2025/g.3148  ORF Transcript_2025/g.3148 Transcript_2025/m.3148 type:complete len:231 (-) Transcript_2025:443-1135(-)